MSDNLARITPLNPRNQGNEQKKQPTPSTTTTPGARAGARAREAIEKIGEYYCSSFGRRNCPPSIYQDIIDALKDGMTAKTITLCIDAAQEAERPSWAYARAIIRRCIVEGALTPEGFEERSRQYQQRKTGNQSMGYQQRPYSQDELEKLSDSLFDHIIP